MRYRKAQESLRKVTLKQGDKQVIEFAVFNGHMPAFIRGYARYMCEVLKVTPKFVYFYLLSHISGSELDCKLQKVQIDSKYETAWAIVTKEERPCL